MADGSNVVFLPGCQAVDSGEPPPSVVGAIRLLLARAERGEIIGIAYATVTPGSTIRTGWRFGASKDSDLCMAAQTLAQRMIANWAGE